MYSSCKGMIINLKLNTIHLADRCWYTCLLLYSTDKDRLRVYTSMFTRCHIGLNRRRHLFYFFFRRFTNCCQSCLILCSDILGA